MLEESVEDLLAAPKRYPLWEARTKHSRFYRRSRGALIGYLRGEAGEARYASRHSAEDHDAREPRFFF